MHKGVGKSQYGPVLVTLDVCKEAFFICLDAELLLLVETVAAPVCTVHLCIQALQARGLKKRELEILVGTDNEDINKGDTVVGLAI